MAESERTDAPRYHRRVLAIGGVVALLAFLIGAPIYNGRVEDDLERRVPEALSEAGFDGVTVAFSGQDGTIRCSAPLDDPEAALDVAYDVWGVRRIDIDRGCRVRTAATETTMPGDEPSTEESTEESTEATGDDVSATAPVSDFGTVGDIIAGSPELSFLAGLVPDSGMGDDLTSSADITLFAPSDAAFDELPADVLADLRDDSDLLARVLRHHAIDGLQMATDLASGTVVTLDGGEVDLSVDGDVIEFGPATVLRPDLVAENGVVHVIDRVLVPDGIEVGSREQAEVVASFADGRFELIGVVATEVERAALVEAAASGVGAEAVDDQLTVDPDTGLDATTTTRVATLVTAMPLHLVSGTAGFNGDEVYLAGRYVTDGERDAMVAIADEVADSTELSPRPEATEDDAEELEAGLNAFAAANPILFEPASDVLTESADAVLDRIARRLAQFDGVSVTVEGHTDSDGTPSINDQLSQQRAQAVVDALVERGLDAGSLTATGFGSSRPVLVDGVEDKAASRRVEFRVEVGP